MRQAGIVAAGALYALDHNVERLAEDHANARFLAEALAQIEGVAIEPEKVESNLVFFEVADGDALAAALAERGVEMSNEAHASAPSPTSTSTAPACSAPPRLWPRSSPPESGRRDDCGDIPGNRPVGWGQVEPALQRSRPSWLKAAISASVSVRRASGSMPMRTASGSAR